MKIKEGDRVFHIGYECGIVLKIVGDIVQVKIGKSIKYFDVSDLVLV